MKSLLMLFVCSLAVGCSQAATPASHLQIDVQAQAFEQKQVRYMTPFDLMQTLRQSFGTYALGLIPHDCTTLTDANRGLLGDSSAATGSPVFSEPSSNFVRWYVGCLGAYTKALSMSFTDKQLQSLFWGPTLTAHPDWQSKLFTDLAEADRVQIVKEQIERMIGPSDVVSDFGYFASSDALATKIATDVATYNESMDDSMKRILQAIALRDEFMSY